MKKITFEISDKAYDLLLNIQEKNQIEFRNPENDEFIELFDLIDELLKYGLIENNLDAWHLTFKLSDFGKEIINNN